MMISLVGIEIILVVITIQMEQEKTILIVIQDIMDIFVLKKKLKNFLEISLVVILVKMELIIIQDLVVLLLKKSLKSLLEIPLVVALAVAPMVTLLEVIDKVVAIKEQVLIQVIEVDIIVFWDLKMEQVKKRLKRLIVNLQKSITQISL